QASPSAGGLPAKSWGTGMASLASRPQRQGLLAQSPKLPSQRGHDHRLVPRPGPDPPGRPSPCVTNFRKPPWYVERMPGGVGGGNREEPAYPIISSIYNRKCASDLDLAATDQTPSSLTKAALAVDAPGQEGGREQGVAPFPGKRLDAHAGVAFDLPQQVALTAGEGEGGLGKTGD